MTDEDLIENYDNNDGLDDVLNPTEKAVLTNWVERPQKDIVYHVVTGARGTWSTGLPQSQRQRNATWADATCILPGIPAIAPLAGLHIT